MLEDLYKNNINNLVDLLRFRASTQADDVLYTFLSDQEGVLETRTFAELDARARAIAGTLQAYNLQGERALMLYPSGLEFVEAFFGCLYAGVIAVPAYPPRKNQKLGRLQSIIDSCQPSVVLCSHEIEQASRTLFKDYNKSHNHQLLWLNTDSIHDLQKDEWKPFSPSGEDLAFLQYTSGSTGEPKGVMINHENIMVNEEMIRVAFNFKKEYRFVSWLPMFHDMGLIGTTLHPVYLGASSVLMTPASFLRQPLRWLKAISDYQAQVSVAPNFAYELCVEQISEEQKAQLDLSSWSHALSGAEPVRSGTLNRFHDYFKSQDFSWDAFYPVYGMAETTLIITGGGSVERPRIEEVSAEAISQNKFQLVSASNPQIKLRDSGVTSIVGVGQKVLDQDVVIINPETRKNVKQGDIGEIWVAGKHVGKGYWNNERLTTDVFCARILFDDGSQSKNEYLRTGDLGCFLEQELFVTGRLKEIIIIRGRNYYPYDIELTAQQSHPYLKADASAAFSVDINGQEQIALFMEVERKYRLKINIDDIVSAIRKAVAREHGLQVYGICLLKPGRIPKTSSGKIQRNACKRAFENDSMEFIAKRLHTVDRSREFNNISISREQLQSLTESERKGKIIDYLRASAAVLLNVDIHEVPAEQALTSLGLDSLQVTQLVSRVREHLQVELAIDELFDLDSLVQVAELTSCLMQNDPALRLPAICKRQDGEEIALSFSQKRLWFLDQLEPGNAAYNNPAALRIKGRLDVRILSMCIEEIVRRHCVLRTRIEENDGEAVPIIERVQAWHLPVEDLSALSPSAKQVEVKCLASEEAACTFDLERGPLFRTRLLQLEKVDSDDEEYVLLLTAHHIVSDGWSLNILIEELSILYASYSLGQPSPLQDLSIQYYDFSLWQQQWLQGEVLERQLNYWREKLRDVPALELPLDFPRPPSMSQRGKQVAFSIPGKLTEKLKTLSQQQGATLFMTLFASFAVLLNRYSGQNDFAIGTPIANRTRAELEKLIGFFVNTLALRVDLKNQPSFIEVLARVQEITLGAYANQDLPFEKLVEELGVVRDMSHTPLFQVMFSFQNSPMNLDVEPNDLEFEIMPVHGQTSKFDLSLDLREINSGIEGFVEYNSDVFEDLSIQRFCDHFLRLLEGISNDPNERIAHYQFLSSEELKYLLVDLNSNLDEVFTGASCIHQYFEQQCERTPNNTAVCFQDISLSYSELNSKANKIAHYLIAQGVAREDLVGVCLKRNENLLAVLLAVLKAGAAYVPLDPNYPSARLEQIVYAAEAKYIIFDGQLKDNLPTNDAHCLYIEEMLFGVDDFDAGNPDLDIASGNLAYVIYTSGSTGLPKGVAIEHRSTAALLHWASQQYTKAELDNVLASTSVCFDLSVFEFFVPLSLGGTCIMVENILDLTDHFDTEVSLINTVPSAISTLLAQKAIPESVRTVNLAGEALAPELVDRLYETAHINKVYDLYGPSEDTTYSTCMLRERFAQASIGRPITNTQVYILDQNLNPVPPGVPGELYLAGAGLARGYYGQDSLTQSRFIENPFKLQLHKGFGSRMYKTGDLVRYISNGDIEYLGRLDFQVKLRGFRIELGEVQSALAKIRNIRDAVAIVRHDGFGGAVDKANEQLLVAYIVFNQGQEIDSASVNSFLRAKLKEMLPAYMVPSVFVPMEEIPLTPNGKTDRNRLPIPDLKALSQNDYREPRNAFEQGMVEIWGAVLGIKKVGIYDNFFDLGGHSLLATQVVARIRQTFHVDLPVRTIFDQPTIFELSTLLGDRLTQGDLFPVEPQVNGAQDKLPLSFAQQRLWFLHLLDKESAAYNMPARLHIRGVLDVDSLAQTFLEIVKRHSVLRTQFYNDNGQAYQAIQGCPEKWDFEAPDLDIKASQDHLQVLETLFEQFSSQAFDLQSLDVNQAEKRLLRTMLIRISAKEHVLLVNMHHIVSDGWSLSLLVKELKNIYEAIRKRHSANLSSLRFQYSDYAIWQRKWISGHRLENQLAYWKEQLKDVSVLEFPSDKPRPAVQSSQGERIPFRFSHELALKLNRLSKEQNVTLFMVMLTGFKALLYRYTGQEDIAVGTPVANRTHPEWESLIGFFVNTLVLRTELSPKLSFIELLKQVQEVTLDAYANQDLPFDKLVEEMHLERDVSHSPLFQVAFTLQSNAVAEHMKIDRLEVDLQSGHTHTAKFDLTMELREVSGEIYGELEYNSDIFSAKSMQSLVDHYEVFMNSLLDNPRTKIVDAQLLSLTEQTIILEQAAASEQFPESYPSIDKWFEQQVSKHEKKLAVKCRQQSISYATLNERANILAHHLIEQGVHKGQLLPLFVDRSIDMVIGVLACLKAGAAYVPIDPMTPDERIEFIIDDVFCSQKNALLLSQKHLLARIKVNMEHKLRTICIDELDKFPVRVTNPGIEHDSQDPAYVIYTSGTTGLPKGVVVSHYNLSRLFCNSEKLFAFNDKDVWTLFHSFSFDFSVWELWGALLYGGTLIVIPQDLSRATEDFYQVLVDEQVTILNQTPSAFSQLINVDELQQKKLAIRKVIFGGEALEFSTLKLWVARHGLADKHDSDAPQLINMYGITETTVHVTYYVLQESDLNGHKSVIGKPLPDLQAYVLDNFYQPVPEGVVGELFVGGAGVANGYLNREKLTREKFIHRHIVGDQEQYLYRTGDLVRRLDDGHLEYLGRIDDQVKIRGFRIELGEIEFNINMLAEVKECIVLIRKNVQGEDSIVAYVAVRRVDEVYASDLRAALIGRLPEYMIPKAFVLLESLPLTVNGKIDKSALPAPDWGNLSSSEYISPRNETEVVLAQIWEDVLKVESVGIYDNFFEIGGHSLLATQIVSRIREQMHIDIPLNVIFEMPTVADIGFYLIEKEAEEIDEDLLNNLLDEIEDGVHEKPDEDEYPGTGTLQNGKSSIRHK